MQMLSDLLSHTQVQGVSNKDNEISSARAIGHRHTVHDFMSAGLSLWLKRLIAPVHLAKLASVIKARLKWQARNLQCKTGWRAI